MKKILAIVLAMILMLGLMACGGEKPAAAPTGQPKTEANAPASEPKADAPKTESEPAPVVEGAGTKVVVGDPKYDDMTADELYELAKAEGGTITIYSDTSKISKMVDAFLAVYPDLKVEGSNLKAKEISAKLPTEVDTGNIVADIILMNDATGMVYNEFYEFGYAEAYFPTRITSHINKDFMTRGLPIYAGSNPWFYNTAQYPDGSPINNWWDVLDKNDDGTQKWAIFCKNIAGEASYMGLYAEMAHRSDEMAAAYKEKTGKDLEYTYDASKTPGIPANNAAYEFLYRLSQLEVTFIDDGDEIMRAIHESQVPALGLGSANKLDNRDSNGYTIAWCTGLKPFTALSNPQFIYVVPGSDNPAGARLFIQWALGGDNGDTKSIDILRRLGQWYLRDDIKNDVNDFTYEEMGFAEPDLEYIYDNYLNINDFWIYWLDQNH